MDVCGGKAPYRPTGPVKWNDRTEPFEGESVKRVVKSTYASDNGPRDDAASACKFSSNPIPIMQFSFMLLNYAALLSLSFDKIMKKVLLVKHRVLFPYG